MKIKPQPVKEWEKWLERLFDTFYDHPLSYSERIKTKVLVSNLLTQARANRDREILEKIEGMKKKVIGNQYWTMYPEDRTHNQALSDLSSFIKETGGKDG